MKAVLYCVCALCCIVQATAQTAKVHGTIKQGRKAVAYAVITGNDTFGCYSNEQGLYELTLPAGKPVKLQYTAMGYDTVYLTIATTHDTILNIDLTPINAHLGEVVVTGVTRATSLRKNPIPIAVISRRDMERNSATNIIDAVAKGVPGVTTVTTGPNISKPFIRGLGYYRVLTMYDGIRQEGQQWGDEHGIEVDDAGIERAEIVKGPASLIYGSDATAGVINLIPWKPAVIQQGFKGDVQANWQSNNGLWGTSAGGGYRKGNWYVAGRLSGKISHDYRNATDGYVYNTGYKEVNGTLTAGIEKKWGYSRIAATLYNNMQEIPDGSRDSTTRQFTWQNLEAAEDKVTSRPIVPTSWYKDYGISTIHQHIKHYRVYTHNQINMGTAGELFVSAGAQQSHRREYNHPKYPDQAGLNVVLNTGTYDAKWALPTWKRIEATVGLNGMYQTNRNTEATDFPIPDYNLFDAGGYIFLKKDVGKWEISGGIRQDKRFIDWKDFFVAINSNTGMGEHVPVSGNLQFPAFSHNYGGASGSVGASYQASKWLMAKANIARGYRAPNVTETGSNGLDPGAHIVYLGNRNFTPEFSLQQDIGLVATFPDWDIALEAFNNNIDHYIFQARLLDANGNPVVIVPGNITYQYRQGKANIYGGELAVTFHPAACNWLVANGNVAYTSGQQKDGATLAMYGDAARYLPLIAPLQARLGARISPKFDLKFLRTPYFQFQLQHSAAQNQFLAADNTETATNAYTLLNVGAGMAVCNKNRQLFRLHVQADNLLDAVYQSHLSRLKYFEYYTRDAGSQSGIYNMGRNVSLKVIVPLE